MTEKIDPQGILRRVGEFAQDVDARGFFGAVVDLLPELWALWQRHRGDVQAMRRALQEQDARLAAGREEADAALAQKHGGV